MLSNGHGSTSHNPAPYWTYVLYGAPMYVSTVRLATNHCGREARLHINQWGCEALTKAVRATRWIRVEASAAPHWAGTIVAQVVVICWNVRKGGVACDAVLAASSGARVLYCQEGDAELDAVAEDAARAVDCVCARHARATKRWRSGRRMCACIPWSPTSVHAFHGLPHQCTLVSACRPLHRAYANSGSVYCNRSSDRP